MDHDIIAKAEAHYMADGQFREKVEEVVFIVMNGISKRQNDSQFLQYERIVVRTAASVALYMQEEGNRDE